MIKNNKVSINNKTIGGKVDGIYVPGGLDFVKEIYVDIQPYSTELLLKDYGYRIEVTKRIFSNLEIDIEIGTILQYTNKQNKIESYEVRKIIPWDSYMEVMAYEL